MFPRYRRCRPSKRGRPCWKPRSSSSPASPLRRRRCCSSWTTCTGPMKAAWRCSTHLVVEQRVGREEVYRFQHALIREVPYEALSRRRKARLHERVGLALEAVSAGSLEEHLEELAHHFAPAHSGTAGEKGVDYCL